jgi:Holliday junction resolvase RusA-like endonuclease
MATYSALRGGWPSLFILPGKPPSKPRPRFGKGRAYASTEQKAAERATGLQLRSHHPELLEGPLVVVMTFYVPDAHRRDADNLVKHLWDAANGVIWNDDSQVKRSAQLVEIDRANPRTEVLLGLLDC